MTRAGSGGARLFDGPRYDLDPERWPLARFRVVDTDDPARALDEAVRLFAPHRLETVRGPYPFRAILNHARLQRLSLYFIRYEPEVFIRSGPPQDYFLFLVPLAGECGIENGAESFRIEPGGVGVVNPAAPLVMHWQDRCAQLVVKVERSLAHQAITGHLGHAPETALRFEARQTPVAACDSLLRCLDIMLADLDAPRPTVDSTVGEAATESLFANLLVRQLPNNWTGALDRPASRAAPYYVKRAEEYMRLHPGEAIRIEDLVSVSGVSARALFKGFRRFRGVGPMAYLKAVRLDRVRSALSDADDPRGVSAVARAFGFRHMGNFAKDYQARFGERPSDTRRRLRR